MSEDEIKEAKKSIDQMSQYSMAYLQRFAPAGHIYFRNDLPELSDYFTEKFKEKGGMTPEISKELGWGR